MGRPCAASMLQFDELSNDCNLLHSTVASSVCSLVASGSEQNSTGFDDDVGSQPYAQQIYDLLTYTADRAMILKDIYNWFAVKLH